MEISQNFDLIVIGGGPGGYNSANKGAKQGLSVALFEGKGLGGVCLNEGCIPSKSFLKSGKIFDNIYHGEDFGVSFSDLKIDQKKVVERKNSVVSKLSMGVRGSLRKNKVKLFFKNATIVDKVYDQYIIECENKYYSCKYLIIATGSKAVLPPIDGALKQRENSFVVTSSEILNLEEIPENLVIIGGGIIGIEMADYFNMAKSKVTVIEYADKICGNLDRECSEILMKNLENKGISFNLSSKVTCITDNSVKFIKDNEEREIVCDKVLIATGRTALLDGFGLENINPKLTLNNKAVLTDLSCKTSIENLYAVGDINGKSMLAHTASREGEVAIDNILGKNSKVDYASIPACIYTSTEAGWVGESEESAIKKGIDFEIYKLPMIYSGRFVAENLKESGICKIIIEKETGIIIGGIIVGSYASEIITIISNFVALKLTKSDIDKLVFPHPSISEIIKDTLNS